MRVHHAAAREVQGLALYNVLRSNGIQSVLMPQLSAIALTYMVDAVRLKHPDAGTASRWCRMLQLFAGGISLGGGATMASEVSATMYSAGFACKHTRHTSV